MQDLKSLREGWEFAEQEEIRLLRRMTVQESLRQWAMLQAAFEPQLRATEALFAEERRQALAELQARLCRLAEMTFYCQPFPDAFVQLSPTNPHEIIQLSPLHSRRVLL